MVEYERQLKCRNGIVLLTRVSSHTKNVTPPQPTVQLLKLLFCGSVNQDMIVYDCMSVCVCVCVCERERRGEAHLASAMT